MCMMGGVMHIYGTHANGTLIKSCGFLTYHSGQRVYLLDFGDTTVITSSSMPCFLSVFFLKRRVKS